jgi:hypothetical protein
MLSAIAAASGGKMTASEVELYLTAQVFPVLTEALADICIVQPANPSEWLAAHLLKLSPHLSRPAPEATPADMATAVNQLRELQQQRDDSLNETRSAQKFALEAESKLNQVQSEAISKDRYIQILEQRCASSEKAAAATALQFKAAADQCKRLEKELEQAHPEVTAVKLQAQAARADEATAKWREAEAAVQQCRHAMQLDADRLQVLCGGAFSVYKLPLF